MFGQIHQVTQAVLLLLTISSLPAFGEEPVNDPFEPYNRMVFVFNDKADRYLLKPVAEGYEMFTPDPIERGLLRMFSNVGEVVNVANDLLQGKFTQAANDSGRFVVNTTIGLAGFFDVADDMGLEKSKGEDFGQTLGYWGVGPGPYLVLPILGASTLRDGPSRIVDSYVDPISEIEHVPTRNSVYGADIITTRAKLLDAEQLVTGGDRYIFIRDVYLQRRAYLVNDGESEDSFGDDFGNSEEYYDYE